MGVRFVAPPLRVCGIMVSGGLIGDGRIFVVNVQIVMNE